ncbi:MAG: polyprotein [Hangzhou Virga-like virus 1]|nr:MAG: polyprotein [Hangzhou Virga-like virus 1]
MHNYFDVQMDDLRARRGYCYYHLLDELKLMGYHVDHLYCLGQYPDYSQLMRLILAVVPADVHVTAPLVVAPFLLHQVESGYNTATISLKDLSTKYPGYIVGGDKCTLTSTQKEQLNFFRNELSCQNISQCSQFQDSTLKALSTQLFVNDITSKLDGTSPNLVRLPCKIEPGRYTAEDMRNAYSDLEIVFSGSQAHGHATARNLHVLEDHMLDRLIGYDRDRCASVSVDGVPYTHPYIEVGPSLTSLILNKKINVHGCANNIGTIDDAYRNTYFMIALTEAIARGTVPADYIEKVFDSRNQHFCRKPAQDCSMTAPVLKFHQCTYDMTMQEFAKILFKKNALVAYETLKYAPEIWDKSRQEFTRSTDGLSFVRTNRDGVETEDGDYVRMKIHGDPSRHYNHSVSNYLSKFTSQIITYGGRYYLREVLFILCGTVYIRTTLLSANEAKVIGKQKSISSLPVDSQNVYILCRFPKDINRKRGNIKNDYSSRIIQVDRVFHNTYLKYLLKKDPNSYVLSTCVSYAASSNVRRTNNGADLLTGEVRGAVILNAEDLYIYATHCYLMVHRLKLANMDLVKLVQQDTKKLESGIANCYIPIITDIIDWFRMHNWSFDRVAQFVLDRGDSAYEVTAVDVIENCNLIEIRRPMTAVYYIKSTDEKFQAKVSSLVKPASNHLKNVSSTLRFDPKNVPCNTEAEILDRVKKSEIVPVSGEGNMCGFNTLAMALGLPDKMGHVVLSFMRDLIHYKPSLLDTFTKWSRLNIMEGIDERNICNLEVINLFFTVMRGRYYVYFGCRSPLVFGNAKTVDGSFLINYARSKTDLTDIGHYSVRKNDTFVPDSLIMNFCVLFYYFAFIPGSLCSQLLRKTKDHYASQIDTLEKTLFPYKYLNRSAMKIHEILLTLDFKPTNSIEIGSGRGGVCDLLVNHYSSKYQGYDKDIHQFSIDKCRNMVSEFDVDEIDLDLTAINFDGCDFFLYDVSDGHAQSNYMTTKHITLQFFEKYAKRLTMLAVIKIVDVYDCNYVRSLKSFFKNCFIFSNKTMNPTSSEAYLIVNSPKVLKHSIIQRFRNMFIYHDNDIVTAVAPLYSKGAGIVSIFDQVYYHMNPEEQQRIGFMKFCANEGPKKLQSHWDKITVEKPHIIEMLLDWYNNDNEETSSDIRSFVFGKDYVGKYDTQACASVFLIRLISLFLGKKTNTCYTRVFKGKNLVSWRKYVTFLNEKLGFMHFSNYTYEEAVEINDYALQCRRILQPDLTHDIELVKYTPPNSVVKNLIVNAIDEAAQSIDESAPDDNNSSCATSIIDDDDYQLPASRKKDDDTDDTDSVDTYKTSNVDVHNEDSKSDLSQSQKHDIRDSSDNSQQVSIVTDTMLSNNTVLQPTVAEDNLVAAYVPRSLVKVSITKDSCGLAVPKHINPLNLREYLMSVVTKDNIVPICVFLNNEYFRTNVSHYIKTLPYKIYNTEITYDINTSEKVCTALLNKIAKKIDDTNILSDKLVVSNMKSYRFKEINDINDRFATYRNAILEYLQNAKNTHTHNSNLYSRMYKEYILPGVHSLMASITINNELHDFAIYDSFERRYRIVGRSVVTHAYAFAIIENTPMFVRFESIRDYPAIRYWLCGIYTDVLFAGQVVKKYPDYDVSSGNFPILLRVNGVAGCGKSTTFMNVLKTYSFGQVMYGTATNSSKDELSISMKHYLSPKQRAIVIRTIGSIMLNGTKTNDVKLLCVDECNMNHLGAILLCAHAYDIPYVICMGDSEQLPYIERECFNTSNFDILPPVSVLIATMNISHRIPMAVCHLWRKEYAKHGGIKTTSSRVGFVSNYKNVNDRLGYNNIDEVIQYMRRICAVQGSFLILCNTQAEKAKLKNYLANVVLCDEKAVDHVLTSHESEGRTVDYVFFVRTSTYLKESLYMTDKLSYLLVATTRVRRNFTYFLPSSLVLDDYSKFIMNNQADDQFLRQNYYTEEAQNFVMPEFLDNLLEKNVTQPVSRRPLLPGAGYDKLDSVVPAIVTDELTSKKYIFTENEICFMLTHSYNDSVSSNQIVMTGPYNIRHDHPNAKKLFENLNLDEYSYVVPKVSRLSLSLFHANHVSKIHRNTAIDNPVDILQSFFDCAKPGASIHDLRHDPEIVSMSELHLNGDRLHVNPVKWEIRTKSYDTLTPVLRTDCPITRPDSFIELLLALFKRNLNSPSIAQPVDEVAIARFLAESFVASYIADDKKAELREYYESKLKPCMSLYSEWSLTQPSHIDKCIDPEFEYETAKLNVHEVMIKNRPKPDLTHGANTRYSSLQTIATQSKTLIALMCSTFREATNRLCSVLNDKTVFFNGMSPQELEERFNQDGFADLMKKYHLVEVDFGKYDKSQKKTAFFVCREIWRILGVDDDFIDLWWSTNEYSKLIDYKFGTSVDVNLQRKSGAGDTLSGNTIFNAAVISVMGASDIYVALVGDDSIFFKENKIDMADFCCDTANLESKFYSYKHPMFCSKFILDMGDYVRVVPDPLKIIVKLGRSDLINYEHVECYRRSLKDLIDPLNDQHIDLVLNEALRERYGIEMDVSTALDALVTVVNSPERFAKMYVIENGAIIKDNLLLPKED